MVEVAYIIRVDFVIMEQIVQTGIRGFDMKHYRWQLSIYISTDLPVQVNNIKLRQPLDESQWYSFEIDRDRML